MLPDDEFNRKLTDNVHPSDHTNPEPSGMYNLVVIGAGTAGLVTAAAAAGLGAKTAIIEKHLFGGDCLNYGCVPSKALIRASKVFKLVKNSAEFGVKINGDIEISFSEVMKRLRKLRAEISANDSVQRFKNLGVDVFLGEGKFASKNTIAINGKTLKFKKGVIATGARAFTPIVKGLISAGFLTNETVFSLTDKPKIIAVIGGGPIGCELAQAFANFGSKVYILEKMNRILLKEDIDSAEIVQTSMENDGVIFYFNTNIIKVEKTQDKKIIHLIKDDLEIKLEVDEIIAGVGRAPNVQGLGLEDAGILYDQIKGVLVNDFLQTSNKSVFAAGDVCSVYKFTHSADAMARIVIANALFYGRQKASSLIIPWVTYTNPEIAHVGISEVEAKEKGISIDTFKVDLKDVDRAVLDGEDNGFAKIHTKKGSDRIVGATIAASNAGNMINEITFAITVKAGLEKIAGTIHPYPTSGEVIKKAADAYNKTRLTPFLQNLFKKWFKWNLR